MEQDIGNGSTFNCDVPGGKDHRDHSRHKFGGFFNWLMQFLMPTELSASAIRMSFQHIQVPGM